METILHTVGMWDTLTLQDREEGIELRVSGEQAPADASNLCWRAAQLLAAQARVTRGVGMVLHKEIPVGAGLGGGSSDVAAVLTGLSRLWNVNLPPEILNRLAGELGSDVPFFLRGGCALALGRGERLDPLPPAALSLVVVVPERRLPTVRAYAGLRRGASLAPRKSLSRATKRMLEAVKSGEARAIAGALHSDFEALEMVAMKEALEAERVRSRRAVWERWCRAAGPRCSESLPTRSRRPRIAGRVRERWSWVRVAPTLPAEESRVVVSEGEEQ